MNFEPINYFNVSDQCFTCPDMRVTTLEKELQKNGFNIIIVRNIYSNCIRFLMCHYSLNDFIISYNFLCVELAYTSISLYTLPLAYHSIIFYSNCLPVSWPLPQPQWTVEPCTISYYLVTTQLAEIILSGDLPHSCSVENPWLPRILGFYTNGPL